MLLKNVIRKRTGDFPESGVKGKETDWLDVGTLQVPTGSLCAVDPMMLNEDDGVVVKVPAGAYVVQAKAMDFNGHLRVSRMRAFLEGTTPTLGQELDEVGTDSASMAICDIKDIYDGFDEEYDDERADRLMDIDVEGGDIVTLKFGKKTMRFAVCESGLGDGAGPAFALKDGRKTVGIELEFMPPGFVME